MCGRFALKAFYTVQLLSRVGNHSPFKLVDCCFFSLSVPVQGWVTHPYLLDSGLHVYQKTHLLLLTCTVATVSSGLGLQPSNPYATLFGSEPQLFVELVMPWWQCGALGDQKQGVETPTHTLNFVEGIAKGGFESHNQSPMSQMETSYLTHFSLTFILRIQWLGC